MKIPELILLDAHCWPRCSHYESFSSQAKCAVHMTYELDVAHFRSVCHLRGLRFYPAMIALVSQVVNHIAEFRMARDGAGRPGVWNFVSPSYTVFHEDDKTFSALATAYVPEFGALYSAVCSDIVQHGNEKGVQLGEAPLNVFHISCLPWIDFSSFSLQLFESGYLAPIITWGKYRERGNRLEMPISIQIHHAAADGYHLALFFNRLQELCNTF